MFFSLLPRMSHQQRMKSASGSLTILTLFVFILHSDPIHSPSHGVHGLEFDRVPLMPVGLTDHTSVIVPLQRIWSTSIADQGFNPSDYPTFRNHSYALVLFGGDTANINSNEVSNGPTNSLYILPWPLDLVQIRGNPNSCNQTLPGNLTDPSDPRHLCQYWIQPVPVTSPAPRMQHVALNPTPPDPALGQTFYDYSRYMLMFGGADQVGGFASLWAYDLGNNRWTGVGPTPDPSQAFPTSSPQFAVDLYFAPTQSTPQLDGAGCPWPLTRGLTGFVYLNGYVYIILGETVDMYGNGWMLGDVWRLNLTDDSLQNQINLQRTAMRGEYVRPDPNTISNATGTPCPLEWTMLTQSTTNANFTGAGPNAVVPSARSDFAHTTFQNNIWIVGGLASEDSPFIPGEIWILHLEQFDQPYWEQIQYTIPGTNDPASRFQAGFFPLTLPLPDAPACPMTFVITGGQVLNNLAAGDVYILRPNITTCSNSAVVNSTNWFFTQVFPSGIESYTPNSRGATFSMVPDPTQMVILQQGGIPFSGNPNNELFVLDMKNNFVTNVLPVPPTQYGGQAPDLTQQPSTRWQAFTVGVGQSVWLYGGTDENSHGLADLWEYQVSRDRWIFHGDYESASAQGQVWPSTRLICTWVAYQTKLYLMFGRISSDPSHMNSDEIWTYDIPSGTWSNTTELVTSVTPWPVGDDAGAFAAGGVERNGFLYPMGRSYGKGDGEGDQFVVFGGLMGQNTGPRGNDLWLGQWLQQEKSIDTNHSAPPQIPIVTYTIQWKLVSPANYSVFGFESSNVPAGRFDEILNLYQNKVWLAFGLNANSEILPDVWCFDLVSLTWTTYSTPITPFYAGTSIALQGKWLIFGGFSNQPSNELWVFDFDTYDWQEQVSQTSTAKASSTMSSATASLSAATAVSTAASVAGLFPSPRLFMNAAKVYSASNMVLMVMFGGESNGWLNDLHILFIDNIEFDLNKQVLQPDSTLILYPHDTLTLFPFSSTALIGGNIPFNFQFATLAGSISYSQVRAVGFVRYLISPVPTPHPTIPASSSAVCLTTGLALLNVTQGCSIESTIPYQYAYLDCLNRTCFSIDTQDVLIGSQVALIDLIVIHGKAQIGGGIAVTRSFLKLSRVQVTACSAFDFGGGLAALASVVDIHNSTFKLNVGGNLGGAISCSLSSLIIRDSLFAFNAIVVAFEDIVFTGGGALLIYNSYVDIARSVFKNNLGHDGGAISCLAPVAYVPSVQQLTGDVIGITITNSSFINNFASFRGSALFISNFGSSIASGPVLQNCIFRNNRAVTETFVTPPVFPSGTVYLQTSATQVINCTFESNTVSGGGGGIFFDPGTGGGFDLAPTLINMTNSTDSPNPNTALYGPFIASTQMNLQILNSIDSTAPDGIPVGALGCPTCRAMVQRSGDSITPSIVVGLVDLYGQVVSIDNTTFISAGPAQYLAGSTTVQVVNGIANFTNLKFLLPPTQSINITFTPSIFLQQINLNPPALTITITSGECQPGEYISGGIVCEPCAPGTFSDTNMTQSCRPCSPGSYQPYSHSSFCYPCAPGTSSAIYSLSDPTCPYCPFGSMTWVYGQSSCRQCDSGTVCQNGHAFAEDNSWLADIDMDSGTSDLITFCTQNVSSFNTSEIPSPSAYSVCSSLYRSSQTCPWSNCVAGHCNDNRLNPPELNPLCGMCEPGFSEVNHLCVECPPGTVNGWLIFLLIAVAFAAVFLLHILSSSSSGSADLTVFLYFIQVSYLTIGDIYGYLSWTHIFRGASLQEVLNTCITPLTAYQKITLEFLAPFFLWALLAILIGLLWLIKRQPCKVRLLQRPWTRTLCFIAPKRRRHPSNSTNLDASFSKSLSQPLLDDRSNEEEAKVNRAEERKVATSIIKSRGEEDVPSAELAFDEDVNEGMEEDVVASPAGDNVKLDQPETFDVTEWRWRIRSDLASAVRTTLALFFFSFQSVSNTIFSHLYCVTLGQFGDSYVFTDPTMECGSTEYKTLLVVLIVLLVLWIVALPLALLALLVTKREMLLRTRGANTKPSERPLELFLDNSINASVPAPIITNMSAGSTTSSQTIHGTAPSVETPSEQDELGRPVSFTHSTRSPSKRIFLTCLIALRDICCSPYQPRTYYYQFVILSRRILLSVLITIFTEDMLSRLCAFSLVHIVLLVGQLLMRPFAHSWTNLMETMNLAILLTLSILMTYQHQQQTNLYGTTFSVIICILVTIPVVCMLAHWCWKKYEMAQRVWKLVRTKQIHTSTLL